MNKYIAQVIGNPALGGTGGQSGEQFISNLVKSGINLAFVGASVFFVFNLIGGGVKWISAGGDKGKLEEARGSVTNAVIGIAVTFSAYAIIGVVELFFGVDLTSFDLSTMRVGS